MIKNFFWGYLCVCVLPDSVDPLWEDLAVLSDQGGDEATWVQNRDENLFMLFAENLQKFKK